MNTDETLLARFHLSASPAGIIEKINFHQLEEFVTHHFFAFINSRSFEEIRYDLIYDVQTPTDIFLSDLLEIGSVQLLEENGLLHHEQFIDALYIILSSMNTVVTDLLRRHQMAGVNSYRYCDADLQYLMLERAVEHAEKASADDRYFFKDITTRLGDLASATLVCE
jgi:hypothetical protein